MKLKGWTTMVETFSFLINLGLKEIKKLNRVGHILTHACI